MKSTEPCWRCDGKRRRIWQRTENYNMMRCADCSAYLGNEVHEAGRVVAEFRAGVIEAADHGKLTT